MTSFRVLHITDFHLTNFRGVEENLRYGFYRDYIENLVEKIKIVFPLEDNPIGALIVTGDFVNRYTHDNFKYAKEIIDYLLKSLNLSPKEVCLCPGNHDIDLTKERIGDLKGARIEYNKFASSYNAGKLLENIKGFNLISDRFSLYELKHDEIYFLSIDSTLGGSGDGRPGTLNMEDEDLIASTLMRDIIPENALLFIATHFPVYINTRNTAYAEEDGWVDKHYWKSAQNMVNRVMATRKRGQTVWVYGDAHFNDFASEEKNQHFFLTGMFGGDYKNRIRLDKITGDPIPIELRIQARVISFDDIQEPPFVHTFNFINETFELKISNGNWEHTPSNIRLKNDSSLIKYPLSISPENIEDTIESGQIVIIDDAIEYAIIDKVRNDKLYTIGRHTIQNDEVVIGWVPINKLMEEYSILSSCVEAAILWLESVVMINNEDTVLIGVDFWGSILASQLSVRMNVCNLCLSTKEHGGPTIYQDPLEKALDQICLGNRVKNIILLTDVISSGKTIHNVYNNLNTILNKKGISIDNWIGISVITDIKRYHNLLFPDFKVIGTFCGNLRMPVLNASDLPTEDIFPVRFDLR